MFCYYLMILLYDNLSYYLLVYVKMIVKIGCLTKLMQDESVINYLLYTH